MDLELLMTILAFVSYVFGIAASIITISRRGE